MQTPNLLRTSLMKTRSTKSTFLKPSKAIFLSQVNHLWFDADDGKLSGLCTLAYWFNPVISMKSNANEPVELTKFHKPSP